MLKIIIFFLLLYGCGYRIEETTVCPQLKHAFKCVDNYNDTAVAICNTLEECTKICAQYNNISYQNKEKR